MNKKQKQKLIDKFAIAAIPQLIQRDTQIQIFDFEKDGSEPKPEFFKDAAAYEELAKDAYCLAWAMFNAREIDGLKPK